MVIGSGFMLVVALGSVIAAFISLWPAAIMANDGSAFTVVGEAWLSGKVPYRDLLVFKPPLIFLADGLGATLGQAVGIGATAGVRVGSVLECALAGVAVAALGRSYEVRGHVAAVFGIGTAAILAGYQFAAGGGLSEPPAFALALASWAIVESGRTVPRLLLAGVMGAAALGFSLLAAPLLVGAGLAVLEPISTRQFRRAVVEATVAGLGAAITIVPVVTWFAMAGALGPLLDGLFNYNAVYAAAGCAGPLGVCPDQSWLPVIALYVAPLLPLSLFAMVGVWNARPLRPALMLLCGLVLAFVLVRRQPSSHYWWPAYLGLLVPAAIGVERSLRRHFSQSTGLRSGARAGFGALVAALVFIPFLSFDGLLLAANAPLYAMWADGPAVAQVIRAQPPGPLFVWGDAASVYVLTDRAPASRYPHIWGLRLPGYTNAERVREACEDLVSNATVAVIDEEDAPALDGARPLPDGLEDAWYRPLGQVLNRGWETVGTVGSLRVLVVKPDADLDVSACDVGAPASQSTLPRLRSDPLLLRGRWLGSRPGYGFARTRMAPSASSKTDVHPAGAAVPVGRTRSDTCQCSSVGAADGSPSTTLA